jgi:hypothetical protein
MGYQHYPCRSDAELPLNLAKVLEQETQRLYPYRERVESIVGLEETGLPIAA